MFKEIGFNKKIVIVGTALLGVALAVVVCGFTTRAHAADDVAYPGYQNATTASEGTASTNVGLKANDAQIKFKAPLVVNFALNADGTFLYPEAGKAEIENASIFDIKISQYDVVSKSDATGCDATTWSGSTASDAYKVSVKTDGTGATAIPFAVSQTISDTATDWTMNATGGTKTKLGLTFSDGAMKKITAGKWGNGADLQTVTWHAKAA